MSTSQTPTFNASPVIPAIIDACRRGVECTLYLDLGKPAEQVMWTSADAHDELCREGFNDLGEMIPFQGGTNEQVVHSMYTTLNRDGKADNLHVFW